MPDLNPSRRSAQSIIDGFLVVGLLALVFLLGCFRQRDADIWWHLKTGQMILQRGELPEKDWFTFTSTDRDWIDLHWLFQITAAKLYSLGGMELLTASSASLGALAVAVMLAARRAGWSLPVAVACWFPVVFLLTGRMYVRPEVVTLVCMSVFLTVLFHAKDRPRLLWALVPVQILWVNVQGLFILGIVLAGFYWVDGLWLRLRRRPESRIGGRTAILMTLVGVSLFNPYHIRGLLFPIELFRKMSWDADFYSKHISELQSIPQFIAQAGVWQFYILVHLGLCALATASFLFIWSHRRFDLFRLLTFAAFAWLGLQATRNSGQFALVAGAVTAWNFGEWFAARGARPETKDARRTIQEQLPIEKSLPELSSFVARLFPSEARIAIIIAGLLSTCWFVVNGTFYKLAGEGRLFGLGEHPFWHAHDAARFAAQPGMPDRLIAFHLGHAAVFEFHMRDEQRTFCDPRLEVVSRELLREYHDIEDAIRQNHPRWSSMLARHDLRVVLIDHRNQFGSLDATVLTHPDWRCVYFDPVAGVYLHRDFFDQLGAESVDFTQRFWEAARAKPKRPTRQTIVSGNRPPAISSYAEAEALLNVARSLQEKNFARGDLIRPMLLLAMTRARETTNQFPDSSEAWRLLGVIQYHLAIQHREYAELPDAHNLVWDSVTMFDSTRAWRALQHARELSPNDFVTVSYSYLVMALKGDPIEQTRLFELMEQHAPKKPTAQLLLEQARREVQSVNDRYPPPDSLRNFTTTDEMLPQVQEYLSQGNRLWAFWQFLKPSEEKPNFSGKYRWPEADRVATISLHYGATDAARKQWEQGMTGAFDGALLHERIADSYLVEDRRADAIKHYSAALRYDPHRAKCRWGLARAYLEQGDVAAVAHECQTALEEADLPPGIRAALEWMLELARTRVNGQ